MPPCRLRWVLVAILMALSPTASLSETFKDGLAAARSGDYQRAFLLWQPLAAQGQASSQLNLGLMYENGHGVSKSYAKAANWYHKAAVQGSARAQFRLGLMYNYGRGVGKDYAAAVQWYQKAAAQGNAQAQCSLGGSYGNGVGITQDYILAHMWLSLAAAQGIKSAGKNRDLIAKLMTAAQMAEAQKLAQDWPAEKP